MERRPQQLFWIDIVGQRARSESGRKEKDDRGNVQVPSQHLNADREHQNDRDTKQDLVC